ncbi:GDSL esterase/lipase At2g27360-like isoform X4 [Lycium ferocissimum]|uniref:GDSL esterase/lipase At2g27360-like isoform X4 n=1 Tax=Lycium ferocissimum TaxID=112874 RepID=UPI002815BAC4|nr:GDSL esterase/lipase At2g27360-like isoform X4 [Lycium ferocissimum]
MQFENNLKVPMASSFSQLTIIYFFACNIFILLASARTCTSCYTSIFGFGDSLTDAGNLIHLYPPDRKPHMYFPPYGKTYFNRPTGRCSDGRLLIDLIGCKKFLESSLFLLGEFGGNDYTHSLLSGKNLNDILPIIPVVVQSIASGAHELVELGAKTIMVPSVLPFGCASSYLTYFESWNEDDYDEIGCLIWPNEFASYHNELLQKELHRLRELHPHVNIIYADYYNAAMQLYRAPRRYGFLEGALVACCGGGGPYNFNIFALCGIFPATSCEDPNQYVNWDGYHLTEAAYRWMTKSLLEGPFTYPPIKNLCPFGINEAQVSQI